MEAAPWVASSEALVYNAAGSGLHYCQPLPLHELLVQYLPLGILRKQYAHLW